MFKKIQQIITNRKLERERKKAKCLQNSLEKILSYDSYTKVKFANNDFDIRLSKYAKLTPEGNVLVITKDDKSGKTVSTQNVHIETFCENYSL